MEDSKPTAGYWALLIGINFYRDPLEHLEGCVRDVDKIKAYLEKSPFSVQIRTFTATVPADPTSRCPSEDRSFWPTFDDIRIALQEITDVAKAGDFIYIHYSGHGTHTMPSPAAYSNHETGDLAFVLFDEFSGRRYFRGSKFAQMINAMVEKGLRKGDVENTRVRATRHAHVIDTPGSLPPSADISTQHNKIRRDGFTVPTWLINPEGYTILTACGPDETAIDAYLAAAQRNPNLYGNGRLSFFGKLLPMNTVFVSVIWRDHQLLLEAGEAQGVCNGDEYKLSPFESPETGPDRRTNRSIKVFVNAVGSLTSLLSPTPDQREVDTGWKAELITPFSSKETTVRFAPEIVNEKYWLGVKKVNRSLKLHADDGQPRPWSYTVNINSSGYYEVLDQEDQTLPGLPVISRDEQDSTEAVMDILNHISRFKFIEDIENRIANASFKQRFTVHMEGPDRRIQEGSGVLNVKDSENVKLVIHNFGSDVLYAYVYNLSPSWGIRNVFPGANHWSIPPKNNAKKRSGSQVGEFVMFVPDHFKETKYLKCRDVFKIFLTSRPIPFISIQMAELCGPDSKRTETTRGDHLDVINLLLGIQQISRESGDKALVEEWTSHNFVIHTVYEKESS